MGEEAFGGEMETFEIKEKIKNAYMLIYERKIKVNDALFSKEIAFNIQESPIYSRMKSDVIEMNKLQKIENILFSDEYGRFSIDLIEEVPKTSHKSAIIILKYIVTVYLTVIIRKKEDNLGFIFLKRLHPVLP
jgi:replicative superfamily II helicase